MKKIYLDEIESTAEDLIRFSKNDINQKIEELKESINSFVWEGLAHDTFVAGYEVKINKIIELNNNLIKIAEFLLRVKDDYGLVNNKIENAYNELLDEFKKIRTEDQIA